jgi:L-alanine-DL-glutamate epimerase-like enolase superfamily enzyme
MKIVELETTIVSVPYRHQEVSSRVHRGGVTDVIVKLTCDNGLVGWGESCSGADAASIEQAVLSAPPFVVGRDPWHTEAIARDFFGLGLWDYRAMTGNFAFAGIDQALWDLCGKDCGQPLYRLMGGPLRDEVDYFCYLAQGEPEDLEQQCRDAVDRGYTCFYLKVGIDAEAEGEMLAAIRRTIGPDRKIRIDANEAWSVPEAARLINRWDGAHGIDFVEAPVPIDPVENMLELRGRVPVALCANEGLGRTADTMRVIRSRCADVLCFSSYWVGTLRRFHTLCHAAHLEGQSVCKHTHGELGIAAAAGHHVMLSIPNATDGIQQTSTMMEHELLVEPTPIAEGPKWGWIEKPGLGVEVDEDRMQHYHEAYRRDGQFLPYRIETDC